MVDDIKSPKVEIKADNRPYKEIQDELFEKSVKVIQDAAKVLNKGDVEYAVFFARNSDGIESFPLMNDGTFVTSQNFNLIPIQDTRFINLRNWVNKSVWNDPTTFFRLPEGTNWSEFLFNLPVDGNQNVLQKTEARIDALKKEATKVK